ncbi:hypothetical protein SAMN05444006_1572 [Allgaiera indica]|uniref:Uncharacterized protein n=1 Tax=Allgaiera indica TaxID=765699 RepID=A0A1H3G2A9_9RHOB|nr:hypothetical protein SAMN05444006_1572 [Allgaiera indica]
MANLEAIVDAIKDLLEFRQPVVGIMRVDSRTFEMTEDSLADASVYASVQQLRGKRAPHRVNIFILALDVEGSVRPNSRAAWGAMAFVGVQFL